MEISCEDDPFGIAGALPACTKDNLNFYDGHSVLDASRGTFCHFTKPDTMIMSSHKAMAVFHSGPNHSSSRKGFKCTFRSVNAEPQCGRTLTAASGSFQSPNWPETYPNNLDCVWTIELPDSSKRVEITFESNFGIAGSLPSCKDHLYIYDDRVGTAYGPFCHFTIPSLPLMSSNQARVEFHSGSAHSSSRKGFKANYRSV